MCPDHSHKRLQPLKSRGNLSAYASGRSDFQESEKSPVAVTWLSPQFCNVMEEGDGEKKKKREIERSCGAKEGARH